MDYELLGKNIARERLRRSLTQEVLAEMTNISTVFLSNIETAKRKPSLETLYKIANNLGVSIDRLTGNMCEETKYAEVLLLLEGKTPAEVALMTRVMEELSRSLSNGRVSAD